MRDFEAVCEHSLRLEKRINLAFKRGGARSLRERKFITSCKQAENGRHQSALSGSHLVFGL